MTAPWPALDAALAALSTAPSRTGSVIATIYGDAILPRGGAMALADLLVLMRRLGATDGVVRTAVSRLAKDGVLRGHRAGRRSVYALTASAETEFRSVVPRIYGKPNRAWDGHLRLAFPGAGTDRSRLDAAGFALIAPGVLLSPWPAPGDVPWLEATGPRATASDLVARAWPLAQLGDMYLTYTELFEPLLAMPEIVHLDAMAARTMAIHAWRRIALRDAGLPPALLPDDWPGVHAREVCLTLYSKLVSGSEQWLDDVSVGDAKLPRGEDPAARFT